MDKNCCFMHAHFDDNWSRCPYPEQVKEYTLIFSDGREQRAYYCDEGAEEARGITDLADIRPAPTGDASDE